MPPKYVPVGTSGRWEVDSSSNCGEGGFGMVYRGRDKGPPPKDCAFKRVPLSEAADIASFKVETETLAVVHGDDPCPHIIQMHGHERIGNDGWLFLEMATGGELFDRLIDYGSLKEGARAAVPSRPPPLPPARSSPPSTCSPSAAGETD